MKQQAFVLNQFFPESLMDEITEIRLSTPEVIETEAQRRRRRSKLTRDGRLVLVAVDHPARGVTKIRGDEYAMGDRWQLLGRARRVLTDPNLDGVLGSVDVLEELLILSHIERHTTGRSFLDDRVLLGSMNRGGLSGAVFEMDDMFTGMSAERMVELGCDGGKMLYRLDPQDPASGRTLRACAQAINALRRNKLAAFVEPLAVSKKGSGYDTAKDFGSLVRLCGIASGLGDSSGHVWLKLPYCEDFERVCRATTLPILLLGGPARESPVDTLRDFAQGLAAGARVRGAIIGRNLLYPGKDDPLPMCRALSKLVHEACGVDEALRALEESEVQEIPTLHSTL